MYTLGISAYYHDSAACIIKDGAILGAISEERLSRTKGDSEFPEKATRSLLKFHNIPMEEVGTVAYYENPLSKVGRILSSIYSESPRSLRTALDFSQEFNLEQLFLGRKLKELGFKNPKIVRYKHHQSHAASAFFPSGFERSAILTIDGVGESQTTSISYGDRSTRQMSLKRSLIFPNSIGLFYAALTSYLGFKVNSGEYKVMGLAPYGNPIFAEILERDVIKIFDDGSVELNLKMLPFATQRVMYANRLEELLGFRARNSESEINQQHCDLASSIQFLLEKAIIRLAKTSVKVTGEKRLCMAGGVALNCVANSKVLDQMEISEVFIQPAAGDAGGALGCAILADLDQQSEPIESKRYLFRDAFLGLSYTDKEIETAIDKFGLVFSRVEKDLELFNQVSGFLANGEVVGWFSGRSEFGPRSLGSRSILGDPRSAEMQSRMNLKIKFRESFRPFAPVVLEEHLTNWFDAPKGFLSPYMLFTFPVSTKHRIFTETNQKLNKKQDLYQIVNEIRSTIPAVTHIDYSARVQTVNRDSRLGNLLFAFKNKTEVPILVNTSFNVRGEPIVESPRDAIECFLRTEIDILVIENFVIRRDVQDKKLLQEWELKRGPMNYD